MKHKISEEIAIPEGVKCSLEGNKIVCFKGSDKVSKIMGMPKLIIKVDAEKISLIYEKAGKRDRATLLALVAHIKNLFQGLEEKFVYEMEICNVHFPMTVKVEGKRLVVSNFLGEKEKRYANIAHDAIVEIKGNKVLVSASNIEHAGQTAANIEKATWISKRDRRVFQDGCFITKKPKKDI